MRRGYGVAAAESLMSAQMLMSRSISPDSVSNEATNLASVSPFRGARSGASDRVLQSWNTAPATRHRSTINVVVKDKQLISPWYGDKHITRITVFDGCPEFIEENERRGQHRIALDEIERCSREDDGAQERMGVVYSTEPHDGSEPSVVWLGRDSLRSGGNGRPWRVSL